jgi:hypothetical protein
MTQYALALSMEPDDPRRGRLVASDIEYLKQFDTPESGVQPQIRLRLARLDLLIGHYDAAAELLASVASDDSTLKPTSTIQQRLDAQNLQIILALQQGKSVPPPESEPTQSPVESVLQYRLLLTAADASQKVDQKNKYNSQATKLLGAILNAHPDLWPMARRRLIERAGNQPAVETLDNLTLRALTQRADLQRQKPKPDHASLQLGLAAAEQLLQRSDLPPQVRDQTAILCPVLLESLGQTPKAATAFIAYAERPEGAYRDAAFDHARWLVGQLRQTAPDDPQTLKISQRFLELAVVVLHKSSFVFDYAQLLQSRGQFKSAAAYYLQTPTTDTRHAAGQAAAVQCLLEAHDPQAAAKTLVVMLPKKLPPKPSPPELEALQLLRPVLEALNVQYVDALASNNQAAMRPPAKARAELSPLLSQWTGQLADRLYDLDCRRQALEPEPGSPERQKSLRMLLSEYAALAKESSSRAMLGEALVHYAMRDWEAASTALRSLLESGALGESSQTYWEARYKLLDADWRLAGSGDNRRQAVRNDLKLLDARWNGHPGGAVYQSWFDALRQKINE